MLTSIIDLGCVEQYTFKFEVANILSCIVFVEFQRPPQFLVTCIPVYQILCTLVYQIWEIAKNNLVLIMLVYA